MFRQPLACKIDDIFMEMAQIIIAIIEGNKVFSIIYKRR